jgi:hypothetical protein
MYTALSSNRWGQYFMSVKKTAIRPEEGDGR